MEGYPYVYEYQGEDIVVLAGDIHTQFNHRVILDQIPPTVKVLFVAGNHEYYGTEFDRVNNFFYELQAEYTNFYHLHNKTFIIDGVHFYGGTMFTDFNLYGETEAWFAKADAKGCIADFHWILKGDRRWTVTDHEEEHQLFREGLELFLKGEHEKRVVITHFMPTEKVAHPQFAGSKLNPYFTANMERFMGWKGLWLCGHGHSNADVMIGDTRVVINPKGYGRENAEGFIPNLIVEI